VERVVDVKDNEEIPGPDLQLQPVILSKKEIKAGKGLQPKEPTQLVSSPPEYF